MNRIAFSLFGIDIYWYAILITSGVLLGYLLAASREKRLGVPQETTLNLLLIALPLALVFARLYFVAFSWDQFRDNLWSILDFRSGGIAIYGSIIGGVVGGLIYARASKVPFSKLADLAAPSLALGQCLGRWGNFVNQEAYGEAVINPGLMWFPMSVWIDAVQEWHYATFFYESAWCLIILVLLLAVERRNGFKRSGDVFLWYMLLYGLERAFVEGLRTDSLYWGTVRISQLLSLLLVVAALAQFFSRVVRPSARSVALFTVGLLLALASLIAQSGALELAVAWQRGVELGCNLLIGALAVPLYRCIPEVHKSH